MTPAQLAAELRLTPDRTIAWLRGLAAKGGKGIVNNIDARCLGRIAEQLDRLTAAIEWVGEVYPGTDATGCAIVHMTWDEFNEMRACLGLHERKANPKPKGAQ